MKNALACKLHDKPSINIIVVSRKTWSTYHCILDNIISLLSSTCLNLISSDTATTSHFATNHPKNCEWIRFCFNSFELFYFYCFILCIFGLSYRGVDPKSTYYDVINIIFLKSLWIVLNQK